MSWAICGHRTAAVRCLSRGTLPSPPLPPWHGLSFTVTARRVDTYGISGAHPADMVLCQYRFADTGGYRGLLADKLMNTPAIARIRAGASAVRGRGPGGHRDKDAAKAAAAATMPEVVGFQDFSIIKPISRGAFGYVVQRHAARRWGGVARRFWRLRPNRHSRIWCYGANPSCERLLWLRLPTLAAKCI